MDASPSLLPSEIARLVLGYLRESGCPNSYDTFLRESPHLQEYASLLDQGYCYPTTIMGKSLDQMLHEHGHQRQAGDVRRSHSQDAANQPRHREADVGARRGHSADQQGRVRDPQRPRPVDRQWAVPSVPPSQSKKRPAPKSRPSQHPSCSASKAPRRDPPRDLQDQGYDNRRHSDRRYQDWGYDDWGYDDRRYRSHDDRARDDRGLDDRTRRDRMHDDMVRDARRHDYRGHDTRREQARAPYDYEHYDRGRYDRDVGEPSNFRRPAYPDDLRADDGGYPEHRRGRNVGPSKPPQHYQAVDRQERGHPRPPAIPARESSLESGEVPKNFESDSSEASEKNREPSPMDVVDASEDSFRQGSVAPQLHRMNSGERSPNQQRSSQQSSKSCSENRQPGRRIDVSQTVTGRSCAQGQGKLMSKPGKLGEAVPSTSRDRDCHNVKDGRAAGFYPVQTLPCNEDPSVSLGDSQGVTARPEFPGRGHESSENRPGPIQPKSIPSVRLREIETLGNCVPVNEGGRRGPTETVTPNKPGCSQPGTCLGEGSQASCSNRASNQNSSNSAPIPLSQDALARHTASTDCSSRVREYLASLKNSNNSHGQGFAPLHVSPVQPSSCMDARLPGAGGRSEADESSNENFAVSSCNLDSSHGLAVDAAAGPAQLSAFQRPPGQQPSCSQNPPPQPGSQSNYSLVVEAPSLDSTPVPPPMLTPPPSDDPSTPRQNAPAAAEAECPPPQHAGSAGDSVQRDSERSAAVADGNDSQQQHPEVNVENVPDSTGDQSSPAVEAGTLERGPASVGLHSGHASVEGIEAKSGYIDVESIEMDSDHVGVQSLSLSCPKMNNLEQGQGNENMNSHSGAEVHHLSQEPQMENVEQASMGVKSPAETQVLRQPSAVAQMNDFEELQANEESLSCGSAPQKEPELPSEGDQDQAAAMEESAKESSSPPDTEQQNSRHAPCSVDREMVSLSLTHPDEGLKFMMDEASQPPQRDSMDSNSSHQEHDSSLARLERNSYPTLQEPESEAAVLSPGDLGHGGMLDSVLGLSQHGNLVPQPFQIPGEGEDNTMGSLSLGLFDTSGPQSPGRQESHLPADLGLQTPEKSRERGGGPHLQTPPSHLDLLDHRSPRRKRHPRRRGDGQWEGDAEAAHLDGACSQSVGQDSLLQNCPSIMTEIMEPLYRRLLEDEAFHNKLADTINMGRQASSDAPALPASPQPPGNLSTPPPLLSDIEMDNLINNAHGDELFNRIHEYMQQEAARMASEVETSPGERGNDSPGDLGSWTPSPANPSCTSPYTPRFPLEGDTINISRAGQQVTVSSSVVYSLAQGLMDISTSPCRPHPAPAGSPPPLGPSPASAAAPSPVVPFALSHGESPAPHPSLATSSPHHPTLPAPSPATHAPTPSPATHAPTPSPATHPPTPSPATHAPTPSPAPPISPVPPPSVASSGHQAAPGPHCPPGGVSEDESSHHSGRRRIAPTPLSVVAPSPMSSVAASPLPAGSPAPAAVPSPLSSAVTSPGAGMAPTAAAGARPSSRTSSARSPAAVNVAAPARSPAPSPAPSPASREAGKSPAPQLPRRSPRPVPYPQAAPSPVSSTAAPVENLRQEKKKKSSTGMRDLGDWDHAIRNPKPLWESRPSPRPQARSPRPPASTVPACTCVSPSPPVVSATASTPSKPPALATASTSSKPLELATASASSKPSELATASTSSKPSALATASTSSKPLELATASASSKPSELATASTSSKPPPITVFTSSKLLELAVATASSKPSEFATTSASDQPSDSATASACGKPSESATAVISTSSVSSASSAIPIAPKPAEASAKNVGSMGVVTSAPVSSTRTILVPMETSSAAPTAPSTAVHPAVLAAASPFVKAPCVVLGRKLPLRVSPHLMLQRPRILPASNRPTLVQMQPGMARGNIVTQNMAAGLRPAHHFGSSVSPSQGTPASVVNSAVSVSSSLPTQVLSMPVLVDHVQNVALDSSGQMEQDLPKKPEPPTKEKAEEPSSAAGPAVLKSASALVFGSRPFSVEKRQSALQNKGVSSSMPPRLLKKRSAEPGPHTAAALPSPAAASTAGGVSSNPARSNSSQAAPCGEGLPSPKLQDQPGEQLEAAKRRKLQSSENHAGQLPQSPQTAVCQNVQSGQAPEVSVVIPAVSDGSDAASPGAGQVVYNVVMSPGGGHFSLALSGADINSAVDLRKYPLLGQVGQVVNAAGAPKVTPRSTADSEEQMSLVTSTVESSGIEENPVGRNLEQALAGSCPGTPSVCQEVEIGEEEEEEEYLDQEEGGAGGARDTAGSTTSVQGAGAGVAGPGMSLGYHILTQLSAHGGTQNPSEANVSQLVQPVPTCEQNRMASVDRPRQDATMGENCSSQITGRNQDYQRRDVTTILRGVRTIDMKSQMQPAPCSKLNDTRSRRGRRGGKSQRGPTRTMATRSSSRRGKKSRSDQAGNDSEVAQQEQDKAGESLQTNSDALDAIQQQAAEALVSMKKGREMAENPPGSKAQVLDDKREKLMKASEKRDLEDSSGASSDQAITSSGNDDVDSNYSVVSPSCCDSDEPVEFPMLTGRQSASSSTAVCQTSRDQSS